MRRFRFTLIAVCLVLLYLGGSDLMLWFHNQSPAPISIDSLEENGPSREWLLVSGGYQDLDRAISTSGSVEMEALLIPLLVTPEQTVIKVLVETRQPHLLELFKQYHFFTDTLPEKQAFRQEHAAEFEGQREITGMQAGTLVARNNQSKLLELAKQTDLEIAEDVIFISEGKEPDQWRGAFYCVVGLLGLIKAFWKRSPRQQEAAIDTQPPSN